MTPTAQRTLILTLLAALMATTRINHFAPVPDASWAVFFLGGVYLSTWTRWAFPLLMALAVVVDYAVITRTGTNFWQHYCVSPAYWCLVPAYFSMWAGGMWLRSRGITNNWRTLGLAGASLVTSAVVCQLIAQGSFYWVSASVASPTLAGWWQNYIDWLPAYLTTAAEYVTVAAVLHVAATSLAHGSTDTVATR